MVPKHQYHRLKQKVISDAKEKAEKLLEDVDSLIGHIKNEESIED